ncbi:hypothetical protein WISP_88862 [Willisornis vidua]|uniref:Uncharacterized protein n=1 Tax=Willisornis vidua TaxID=1566151 RepID=A0ABQ9D244_9PASS|nr:hypothetical protein WISP_88862 [Willisornis vidua]
MSNRVNVCLHDRPVTAKVDPISDNGSTSGIIYLRRWKKSLVQLQPEKEMRICKRNSSADTKDLVRKAPPLQPKLVHSASDIHLQPVEDPMLEQVDARSRLCGKPMLEQISGRTSGTVEGSPHWSKFSGRTCDPMGHPHWSSLFVDYAPCKGPTVEQLVKTCSLWEWLM